MQADPALRMGSVRVQVNETVVQDLIENRIEALARRLLQNPEAWAASSSLLQDVVEQVPVAGASDRSWAKGRASMAQGSKAAEDVLDVQAVPRSGEAQGDWDAQATGIYPQTPSGE